MRTQRQNMRVTAEPRAQRGLRGAQRRGPASHAVEEGADDPSNAHSHADRPQLVLRLVAVGLQAQAPRKADWLTDGDNISTDRLAEG